MGHLTLVALQRSYLVVLPPFHAFTVPVQHALPLRNNIAIFILPRFEEASFVKAIETFKIHATMAVPPILLALSKQPASKLKSIRNVFVGGSPLPLRVQDEMYEGLSPEAKITQVYGMTEVGWTTCWSKESKDRTGSIGQKLAAREMR